MRGPLSAVENSSMQKKLAGLGYQKKKSNWRQWKVLLSGDVLNSHGGANTASISRACYARAKLRECGAFGRRRRCL